MYVVTSACADLADLIAVPASVVPQVKIFDVLTEAELDSFFAFGIPEPTGIGLIAITSAPQGFGVFVG
jgi:hypothetical protein